jgi:hypothetical protein
MKSLKSITTSFSFIIALFIGFNSGAQELSELSKDKSFVSYVKDQLEFNKNNNIEQVNELASQKEIGEGQLGLIYEAFNTNEKQYNEFVKLQNSRMLILREKYNLASVSIDELSPIVGLVFDQVSPGSGNQTEGEPCRDRYNNTLVNIAASAVIAHAGCVAADVTIVVGIICHGAVTAWWITENNDAEFAYQDCLKG